MNVALNLLPPGQKVGLRDRRRMAVLLEEGIKGCFLMLLAIGLLAGIRFTLGFQVKDAEALYENARTDSLALEVTSLEEEIRQANQAASAVTKLESEHLYWSVLFEQLEATAPEGVRLHEITTLNYRASLVGTAKDRATLLLFQGKAEQNECFEKVTVPLSNLFVQQNVSFQMDIDVRKTCLKGRHISSQNP